MRNRHLAILPFWPMIDDNNFYQKKKKILHHKLKLEVIIGATLSLPNKITIDINFIITYITSTIMNGKFLPLDIYKELQD